MDGVRALKRELQLAELVLDSYIPKEYQALIERYVHWHEQLGEWQVRCVAYTGNNMAPRAQAPARAPRDPPDLADSYLSYASCVGRRPVSAVPRPNTAIARRQ